MAGAQRYLNMSLLTEQNKEFEQSRKWPPPLLLQATPLRGDGEERSTDYLIKKLQKVQNHFPRDLAPFSPHFGGRHSTL